MRLFKAIIAGILGGAALFFLPFFILRFFLFILFISLLIRLIIGIGFGRRGGFRGRNFNSHFADKIRSMNDEEYNRFKQNFYNSWEGTYQRNTQPDTIVTID